MKVVAINGSAKKDGNTYLLLKSVLDELKTEGIETDLVQLADGNPIQGCTACRKCMERKNMKCAIETDPFNEYFAKISQADGILLGSPVYFSDITAGMKGLIERCGFVGGPTAVCSNEKSAPGSLQCAAPAPIMRWQASTICFSSAR